MKTVLLLFLLFTESRCSTTASKTSTSFFATDTTNMVYICDSPGGKKYHYNSNCKGLGRCTHKIIKISLKEAKRRGKTLCGYEKTTY